MLNGFSSTHRHRRRELLSHRCESRYATIDRRSSADAQCDRLMRRPEVVVASFGQRACDRPPVAIVASPSGATPSMVGFVALVSRRTGETRRIRTRAAVS